MSRTKKSNGCPYRASGNGACTHKGTTPSIKGKRYCGHKQASNCPLFKEWLSNKNKMKSKASKSLIDTWETSDDT